MGIKILENQPLSQHVTMQLGGPAKFLTSVTTEQELLEALSFAKTNNIKALTLGGGSNIIFSDAGFDGLIILNQIKGLSVNDDTGEVDASSGEAMDSIIAKTINANLSGIEALSLIPGTVGAAPINNIGAYGQEIKNTITKIRAYDTSNDTFVELSNNECQFSYRSSIFKDTEYGRYVITKVFFKLAKANENYKAPGYRAVQTVLQKQNPTSPTPQQIRDIVIGIRAAKLPNPKITPNTGSFFKNPIVSNEFSNNLLKTYPDMVHFDHHGQVKLAAGWLVDKAGLKGLTKNGIKISDKQALVLINEDAKSYTQLEQMKNLVQNTVYDKFKVKLEPEPELL